MNLDLDHFNPFDHVVDSGSFPHSHSLRSSLEDKVVDTFTAFAYLIDFPTLWLFKLIFALTALCEDFLTNDFSSKKKIERHVLEAAQRVVTVIYFPLKIFNYIVNDILRNVFAAYLTVIAFPLIALAHFITHLVAKHKTNVALTMQVTSQEKKDNIHTTQTLREFLNVHNAGLSHLQLTKIKSADGNDEESSPVKFPVQLEFSLATSRLFKAKMVCSSANNEAVEALAHMDDTIGYQLDQRKFFNK